MFDGVIAAGIFSPEEKLVEYNQGCNARRDSKDDCQIMRSRKQVFDALQVLTLRSTKSTGYLSKSDAMWRLNLYGFQERDGFL